MLSGPSLFIDVGQDCDPCDVSFSVGKSNAGAQAAGRAVAHGERPTLRLDDCLRDGQTEADSASLPTAGFLQAIERLEDTRKLLLRNAWTIIVDRLRGGRSQNSDRGMEWDTVR